MTVSWLEVILIGYCLQRSVMLIKGAEYSSQCFCVRLFLPFPLPLFPLSPPPPPPKSLILRLKNSQKTIIVKLFNGCFSDMVLLNNGSYTNSLGPSADQIPGIALYNDHNWLSQVAFTIHYLEPVSQKKSTWLSNASRSVSGYQQPCVNTGGDPQWFWHTILSPEDRLLYFFLSIQGALWQSCKKACTKGGGQKMLALKKWRMVTSMSFNFVRSLRIPLAWPSVVKSTTEEKALQNYNCKSIYKVRKFFSWEMRFLC